MTHPRKQIKDAVVTALTGETGAGANVFSNRSTKYSQTELPAITVIYGGEESEEFTAEPQELKRTLNLALEVRAESSDDVDDVLDALAFEVEQVLGLEFFVTTPFFGLSKFLADMVYTGANFDFSSDGEKDIGMMTLIYQFVYTTETPLTAPSTIDNLDEVDVEYEMQEKVADDKIDGLYAP